MPSLRTVLISAVLLCGCGTSGADVPLQAGPAESAFVFQRLPAPADVLYLDTDPATITGAEPGWKAGNPRHLRMAREKALGPAATPQDAVRYAHLLSLKGDRPHAMEELQKAKLRFPANGTVLWSEGWIELNLGHHQAALHAWQLAEAQHGGRPYWVPYTKALAFVAMGDNEAAQQWWTVAQRSMKPHLDSPAKARRYFSYWRPAEKDLLDRVLALTPAVGPLGTR